MLNNLPGAITLCTFCTDEADGHLVFPEIDLPICVECNKDYESGKFGLDKLKKLPYTE